MKPFKIGDRVRAVKDCNSNYFKKGEIGTVVEIYDKSMIVDLGYYRQHVAYFDEIELIEPEKDDTKPFPTFEEFNKWFAHEWDGDSDTIYNYFAQFGVRTVEVFPEVGKEYEIHDGRGSYKGKLGGFQILTNNDKSYTIEKFIRPIQPSRLEQLKAKHPNLTDDEKSELLDILLT